MANTVWIKVGNTLHQTFEGSREILKDPEKKIYNLCQDIQTKELYLEEISDGFTFPFKIYGLETEFMNYVEETYKNTNDNLGILLDGKKGTGKTITAKILAMRFNKPIILVPSPFIGLQDFISKFTSECIFFFDEFEKTFGRNRVDDDGVTSMLLSVMDGTYNTARRQVFLLTTNKTYIDENFLGRPSRIRYHKTFNNLKWETVDEIINDLLIDKSRAEEVKNLVDSLALSTIDTLKAIITDINIHPNVPINTVKEYLNLEFAKHVYNYKEKIMYADHPKFYTYNLADMEEELSHVGEIYVEDGEEYEHTERDFNIYTQTESTDNEIGFLQIGDTFRRNRIIKSLDEHNCLLTENGIGTERHFIHILNPDNKPSLYGQLKQMIGSW